MCYVDKLIVMPEHATLAPPICRLAGEVLSIGRRVTQKGVFPIDFLWRGPRISDTQTLFSDTQTLINNFLLTIMTAALISYMKVIIIEYVNIGLLQLTTFEASSEVVLFDLFWRPNLT